MAGVRVGLVMGGLVACASVGMAQGTFRNELMPVPASLSAGTGALALASTFVVDSNRADDARLAGAIARAVRRVELEAGLAHAGTGVTPGTKLVVRVAGAGGAVQGIDEDESYSLKVTAGGVELSAATDVGAMHGLETLVQLVQPGGSGYVLPEVTIEDAPRFRWRGLMIDCGRHFEPVAVIKRTLDGMAAVKLNVFHWHLTEDQGFRMESLQYPKLTGLGSDGNFYTQAEAREVVAYARDRGIRVVPEFEMPGHSTAWLVAYPELASGAAPAGIRREFGVSNDAMDPTRDETYAFIDRFLGEMAGIFPDEYVHIGGDEAPAPDWKKNPRIVAFMKAHDLKDNDALQAYFNTRVLKTIGRLHKRMEGWDEVLTPGLPKDVVVQSWRGAASLSKGAKLGYQGVLSAPYYLDAMKPAGVYYLADPLPADSDLTAEERKRILGGEVCMWAEHLDQRTIDSRVWPRTAAIAERFWSKETVKDVDEMYRRLEAVSIELEGLGLTHLQSGDAGLRDLAGTEKIDALRTFASVLEPVSFGERYKAQRTNQLTALDRLVDAVRPDPLSRYWSGMMVKTLMTKNAAELWPVMDAWFAGLGEAVPEVKRQIAGSPRLSDAGIRADQLAGLAAVGREAVGYLSGKGRAPAGWKAGAEAKIAEAKKPSALVRFTFLDALSELVKAVPN